MLHVITALSQGGAEAVLYRLVSGSPSSCRHTVVSMMDEGIYGPLLREWGATVFSLGMPRGRLTWRGLRSLLRIVRQAKPDVVQTWMYHANLIGGIIARSAGVRTVVWGIHNPILDPFKVSALTRLVATMSAKLSSKLSFFAPAAIVCVSQDTLQEHVRIGYRTSILDVIHNGVDLSVFRPSDTDRARVRKELGVGRDELLVGFVARWDPFKDHENLLKALALLIEQVPTLRCALVGAGMDTSNRPLMDLVREHKLQNHLILAGSRHDIPAVMNALDLHVLSSSAESFGNVVAEAMACGTPCVVTDVGAAALIVGDTGWVVAPKQPTALAAGIELALATLDKQERRARGQQCRERIKRHFSLDVMVNSYIRLWGEAAKRCQANNADPKTVEGFGDEWTRFDQTGMSYEDTSQFFEGYFSIFPWAALPKDAVGFDLGCGSGRWAKLVAPRVGALHCIDPSVAIEVARRNLSSHANCEFHQKGVDDIPLRDRSMDFGYSLGVLHHIPDTRAALAACVAKLKPGAPFLLYLYYAFDNRPMWFCSLWRASDWLRKVVSRMPPGLRYALSQAIAGLVYWPLARSAKLAEALGVDVANFPLSFYRDCGFYVMRTDALDRFGTPLEQRFTKAEINTMMEFAGLENIRFRENAPFWCAVGYARGKACVV